MKKIAILGAGTWGASLARAFALAGHSVTVWSKIDTELSYMKEHGGHKNLPGMVLPQNIELQNDIERAVQGKDVVVFAVASPFIRNTAREASPYLNKNQIIADVAKGIEENTLYTLSEVIRSELECGEEYKIVALSGPTHAEEVALDMPTTIVAASSDENAAGAVQDLFDGSCIRAYTNPDVIGVELAGALKNIVALAAGISQGIGFGDNIRVAIITRGIAEMSRLGDAMGADRRTFAGLAGIGDLIVTATSRHSRNNKAGYLLGKGYTKDEAIAEVGMVVEGINALPAAMALKKKYGVDMPIIDTVNKIVNEGLSAKEGARLLFERNKKSELDP